MNVKLIPNIVGSPFYFLQFTILFINCNYYKECGPDVRSRNVDILMVPRPQRSPPSGGNLNLSILFKSNSELELELVTLQTVTAVRLAACVQGRRHQYGRYGNCYTWVFNIEKQVTKWAKYGDIGAKNGGK